MRILFILLSMIFLVRSSFAQQAEKLDLEISALGETYQLDNIDQGDYFTMMGNLASDVSPDSVNEIIIGSWWRYSHTVYPDGKEVRIKNARGILKFLDETNGYYIARNNPDTVWCDWKYEGGQMLLSGFETKSKEGNPGMEPLNIHSISQKRLVLSTLIRSTQYPGKYRAVFHVYFRR